jgi:hypothetical protein
MKITRWIGRMAERVRGWSNAQKLLAGILAIGLALAVLAGGASHHMSAPSGSGRGAQSELFKDMPDGDRQIDQTDSEEAAAGLVRNAVPPAKEDMAQTRVPGVPGLPAPTQPYAATSPMIAHSAEVAVATKKFAQARTTLEEILENHRGYAAKLRMVGQKSGSVLSAMLRVPSTELGGTVSDLKSLGDVEREEQNADEVTQQHADIEARLLNARNTLHRLQEFLKKQNYPDGNVRELQRQIANASAEVNRLEAERQNSEHRVVFANVKFTLREQITTPAETLGAQIRHAAGEGFGDASASLTALLVFVIGRGPALLLWAVILFLPVRWIWKKLTPLNAAPATAAPAD